MAATSRRVSYILPTPSEPPPLLALPPLDHSRRGHTAPFFLPKSDPRQAQANGTSSSPFQSRNPFLSPSSPPAPSRAAAAPAHPRHCLGITSLALDTSTILSNASAPGGILYTGGRDGLVASWELGIAQKRRRGARYESLPGRGPGPVKWEKIGDGAEYFDDEDEEDEDEEGESTDEDLGDGWVGVDGERRKRRGEVPYEDRWEMDREALAPRPPPPTAFRQSAQTHTDWVNAMLLCNLNQTVITASSDRTIRAWTPHASNDEDLSPTLVGTHRDYVRSLAWAKGPSLLFSGSLDRKLSIWDVQSPHPDSPIMSIDMSKTEDYGGVGMEGERGSVYALGVDPAGKVLAAGTPERVVRLWDPRQGERSIGKLIGHSDCVRSVIVSEDGRYMLTGSSDTTIKLWSLAAYRCLHTFNHHTSSVWALHSDHPNLERFYSGARDGHLCVVDLEQCVDMADGECVVLAREGSIARNGDEESKSGDEGIRCIVAMDDEFVWTATGAADVKRWRDVGRKANRTEEELDGASFGDTARNASLAVPSGLGQPFNPTTDGVLRNKRLSLDGTPSESLFRTESRDSRSVAFAATPSPRSGPAQQDSSTSPGPAQPSGTTTSPNSGIPSIVRGRLNPPQQRQSALSGASIAGSFVSDSTAADDGPMTSSGNMFLRNGIPYDSLVSLGASDSPYSFAFSSHRQDEPSTLPSGTSVSSAQHGMNDLLRPEVEASPRRGSTQPAELPGSAQIARIKFEDRELASEATPLRKRPDEVIAGRSGLVRSLMLNDRQHVLTVDTDGEVAAWNVIRGVCIGRFSSADVAAALDLERGVKASTAVRKHSNEVLELVKERVEGETMVITWCQVDTKIGSLVVHLEEGRVFDAEIYADEMGLEGIEGMGQDARINLGKWALGNLFKGLIKAEEREVMSNSPNSTHSSLPSLNRGTAPTHISLDRPFKSPPHRSRALSNLSTNTTVSLSGIASPPATPALLPDVESPLSRSAPIMSTGWQSMHALRAPLSAIPQSPVSQTTGSPVVNDPTRDYFSMRKRNDPSPSRDGDREKEKMPPTPGASLATPAMTPGGSSLMGKLKVFGKKKAAETPMLPVLETETPVDTGPKLTEREAAQLHILDTVRASPFRPPAVWDAPPLEYPPNTSLLISEESKDAGAWVVTYRSQVGSTEKDMVPLENNSPMWLLDYLFTSRTRVKDPVKLTFILEPAIGSGLKEMPEGTTRLSASRVLRARKILAFIFDKLELGPSRTRQGSTASMKITSIPRRASVAPAGGITQGGTQSISDVNVGEVEPEEVLELLCGSTLVDPKITLATLKHYYGSGGDMLLHYRLKEGFSV